MHGEQLNVRTVTHLFIALPDSSSFIKVHQSQLWICIVEEEEGAKYRKRKEKNQREYRGGQGGW